MSDNEKIEGITGEPMNRQQRRMLKYKKKYIKNFVLEQRTSAAQGKRKDWQTKQVAQMETYSQPFSK